MYSIKKHLISVIVTVWSYSVNIHYTIYRESQKHETLKATRGLLTDILERIKNPAVKTNE